MASFVKVPASIYRLFIGNILSLKQEINAEGQTEFFMYENQVKQVVTQGVVIYVKLGASHTLFVLDDTTGTINCVIFAEGWNQSRLPIKVGDLVRVKGKLEIHNDNFQIKVKGNPYIMEDFDEEIEWYQNTSNLWNKVYTSRIVKTPKNSLKMQRHYSSNKDVLELKLVSLIRETGKTQINYQEILQLAIGENETEEAIYNLVVKGFLEPFNRESALTATIFDINPNPFHPKELILQAFKESNRPLNFSELRAIANQKFQDNAALLSVLLEELKKNDVIYERNDQEFALIS
ncbi:unnamed protein product [Blepharisma stoltei]|uniref:OB domain-containing protein n=1 Tax=Blepharisma stoltei TaxID=1481888 RepID=A0AAU9JDJ5_9CILI|nr:unnamed protein product [Blepharisma stoltei]